jgi:hypothetical protein
MPKDISSHFKFKKNQICILESYSDENIKERGKAIIKANKKNEISTVNT